MTTPEDAALRNKVWAEIATSISGEVRMAGGSLEWTMKNLRGWWEDARGCPVEASDPTKHTWVTGVWSELGGTQLQQTWIQLWSEDKQWLIRKAAPDYGLGPGKGMAA